MLLQYAGVLDMRFVDKARLTHPMASGVRAGGSNVLWGCSGTASEAFQCFQITARILRQLLGRLATASGSELEEANGSLLLKS